MPGAVIERPGTAPAYGAHFEQVPGWRTRASRWLTSPADSTRAVALASAIVTLLTWRSTAWGVAIGGIDSWQTALALGFQHHIQWGPQAIFTFGPYGFVEAIMPYGQATGAIAIVYTLAISGAVTLLVISALHRTWGLVASMVTAWFVVGMAANLLESPELALASALGLVLIATRAPGARWPSITLAALAGFQFLVQVNVGLVTAGALAVALVARRDARTTAISLGVFVAVPVLALIAAGQSLGNFPSYLRGSLEVMLGYAGGMAMNGHRGLENWFALADVVVVVAVYALYLHGRTLVERVLVPLFLAGWLWEALKEGFIRHDKHDLVFFGLVMVAACITEVPRHWRAAQAVAVVFTATTLLVANAKVMPTLYQPAEDIASLVHEAVDLAVPSKWAKVEKIARYQERKLGTQLSSGLLRAVSGRTMAAEPFEDSFGFEYPQLRWDPEPVLQGYSAYTPYLDHADARFLASKEAPERILYRTDTLDGQDPYWMPPATTVAMACNYSETGAQGGWLVLARVSDRCGRSRLVRTVVTRGGTQLAVPRVPAGYLEVATFRLATPLSARLADLALKPAEIFARLWPADAGKPVSYRFITGTAGDVHLVHAPQGARWAQAGNVRALSIGVSGRLEVKFYAVPFASG